SNGEGTNASFNAVYGVACDSVGNIYVADTYYNQLIRLIATNGVVTTLAGGANPGDGFYAGAGFYYPYGIALDSFGNVYIADTYDCTIRVGHYAQVIVPSLTLTSIGNNRILNWQVPTNTYRLLSSLSLMPAHWTAITNIPFTVASHN